MSGTLVCSCRIKPRSVQAVGFSELGDAFPLCFPSCDFDLLDFSSSRRPNRGSAQSRSFFKRLLTGEAELKCCLKPDVSKAQFDIQYLNATQLLHIRNLKEVGVFTADGSHSSHFSFIRTVERCIYTKLFTFFEKAIKDFSLAVQRHTLKSLSLTEQENRMLEETFEPIDDMQSADLRRCIGFELVRTVGLINHLKQYNPSLFQPYGAEEQMWWLIHSRVAVHGTNLAGGDSAVSNICHLFLAWPSMKCQSNRPAQKNVYWYIDHEKLQSVDSNTARTWVNWDVLKIPPSVDDFAKLDPSSTFGRCVIELKENLRRRPELSSFERDSPAVNVPRASRRRAPGEKELPLQRCVSLPPVAQRGASGGNVNANPVGASPSWMRSDWRRRQSSPDSPRGRTGYCPAVQSQKGHQGPRIPKLPTLPKLPVPDNSSQGSRRATSSNALNLAAPMSNREPGNASRQITSQQLRLGNASRRITSQQPRPKAPWVRVDNGWLTNKLTLPPPLEMSSTGIHGSNIGVAGPQPSGEKRSCLNEPERGRQHVVRGRMGDKQTPHARPPSGKNRKPRQS
eukprot:GHVN01066843.1.p1 GENE.GHVN01066843.1~~GHVN01066843.1.p1  ORF type:complete len:566 (+),score=31.81 GHVN01066843.1:90-1787(+)